MHKVNISGLDTSRLPKIDKDEFKTLIDDVRAGNMSSREKLIMANLRLVLSVVQRFNGKGNADDLFQVGVVGLIKAIDNFDPSYNVQFSTYAVPMIVGEIRRYLKDSSSIKVSRSMRDIAYKALHARELMERRLERTPNIMEVAEEIDVPISDVACALDAVSETRSIYESVYNDGEDNMLLMDQLSDNKGLDDVWEEGILIRDCIKKLPIKERQVLTLRYYIGKTQVDIARVLSVSQAQVSRLEKTALAHIKDMIS